MVVKRFIEFSPLLLTLFVISSISPFLVCLVFFFLMLNRRNVSDKNWYAVIVLSAICIGAINAAKVPDNDLEVYIKLYHMSKTMPLGQYILIGSSAEGVESMKEPFYPVLVWILNKLCLDNELFFKFIFTFINYSLLNTSILIVGKHNKIEPGYILAGMFLMTFTPFIFTLSLHAMRQFIAGAFFMMILSLKCFSTIKQWKLVVLSLLMILLHTTSLLFIPFLFFKAFDRKWAEAKIWYIGIFVGLVMIRLLSMFFLGVMGLNEDSGLAGYALSRAAQESGHEVEAISIIGIAVVIVIIYSSFYFFFISKIKEDSGIRRFFNIPFFIGLFVLLNLSMKELALRFLFYLYFFVPFIGMFWFRMLKIKRFVLLLVLFPILLYFLFYLEFGVWTYDIPYTVFFTPLFAYLYS